MIMIQNIVKKWLQDENGAVVTEYALLLALVAIGLIATLGTFRGTIVAKLAAIGNCITQSTSTSTTTAC